MTQLTAARGGPPTGTAETPELGHSLLQVHSSQLTN